MCSSSRVDEDFAKNVQQLTCVVPQLRMSTWPQAFPAATTPLPSTPETRPAVAVSTVGIGTATRYLKLPSGTSSDVTQMV